MTTAAILLVSGVLIGAGISIIWRDVRAKHRRAFVTKLDARRGPEPDPEVEITISYDAQPAAAQARPLATSAPLPVAVLLTPVVLYVSVVYPFAVLLFPVVFE